MLFVIDKIIIFLYNFKATWLLQQPTKDFMNIFNSGCTASDGRVADTLSQAPRLALVTDALTFNECPPKAPDLAVDILVSALQSALGIQESVALGHFVAVHEYEPDVPYRGRCPWSLAVMCNASEDVREELRRGAATENEVKAFCRSTASDHACFFYVVAWGGMRPQNARRAYAQRYKWLPIVRAMRERKCEDRRALFDRFSDAKISGLAAAYFTKLMYFCCPGGGCYILDQWTARSINLIFGIGNQLIYMSSRTWVDRRNKGTHYEKYCMVVEVIANVLRKSPREIEQAMFAGRAYPWRKYIKAR